MRTAEQQKKDALQQKTETAERWANKFQTQESEAGRGKTECIRRVIRQHDKRVVISRTCPIQKFRNMRGTYMGKKRGQSDGHGKWVVGGPRGADGCPLHAYDSPALEERHWIVLDDRRPVLLRSGEHFRITDEELPPWELVTEQSLMETVVAEKEARSRRVIQRVINKMVKKCGKTFTTAFSQSAERRRQKSDRKRARDQIRTERHKRYGTVEMDDMTHANQTGWTKTTENKRQKVFDTLPTGRKEYKDHKGKPHYCNTVTKETRWERPQLEPSEKNTSSPCEKCGKTFTTAFSLRRHGLRCHGSQKGGSCSKCGRFYKSIPYLRSHQQQCDVQVKTEHDATRRPRKSREGHGVGYAADAKIFEANMEPGTPPPGVRVWKSGDPELSYPTKTVHRWQHPRSPQCNYCGNWFGSVQSRMAHMKHGCQLKPFVQECFFCHASFSGKKYKEYRIKHQGACYRRPGKRTCQHCKQLFPTFAKKKDHQKFNKSTGTGCPKDPKWQPSVCKHCGQIAKNCMALIAHRGVCGPYKLWKADQPKGSVRTISTSFSKV